MRWSAAFRRLGRAGGIVVLLLAGCASVVAPPPPAQATYDLGPGEYRDGERIVVDVVAPPWIDQVAMRYRLGYADPHEVRSYTRSRWEASPVRLLAARLGQGWSGPPFGGCRLAVDVDEWIHEFAAPDRSRVILAVDARVVDRAGRRIAQRNVRSEVPAARHDAPGMAAASREAAVALQRSLGAWLAGETGVVGPGCQAR